MAEPEESITQHQEGDPEYGQEPKSDFPAAFLAGAVVVLIVFAGIMALIHFSRPTGPTPDQKLPFGAVEQAYAERIHFSNIQMARAKNMLDQEFTYVVGTTSNDGTRSIRGLDVTIEFRDPFNQVVLRQTERLIGISTGPLDAGQKRDFQITLEHVPAEWNQQYPAFRVTGLILD
jgi:hypothetical protein